MLHYIASGELVLDEARSKFWKFPPMECVSQPATPAGVGSPELARMSAYPKLTNSSKSLLRPEV